MKLRIKDMDIETGGPLIVTLNQEDATLLDLHPLDRIKVIKGKKIETCVLNIAESSKFIAKGRLGVSESVIDSLKLKNNDYVNIMLARKPVSLKYIKKKLDGFVLTKKEIDQIVWDIVHNKLSQIELTYFVAACYTNLMSADETIMLTKAMASHGDILKLNKYPVIDKHCIGGVAGNRTTMVVVPIIAAAGYTIPKTSSRSITSPAGTADTMEVLADVSFSLARMKRIVEKTNGCMVWGGAINLAPADDKIIKVEKPMDIDAESQLIASIMAKKHSVSSTHILIDIPVGRTAKVESIAEAERLKKHFELIGKKLKKKVRVVITDGSQPIGNGIGPALEARDVLMVLRQDKDRPADLEKKSLHLAGKILGLVGVREPDKKAAEILCSGKAYEKFKEIVKAQKGNPNIRPSDISLGKYSYEFCAPKAGRIEELDNKAISKIARVAGAPTNCNAGLYLFKHLNDKVEKNEPILKIFAQTRQKLEYALEVLKTECAVTIK